MNRAAFRDPLIVSVAGLIAPSVWLGAWGLLVAYVWMPLIQVARPALQITDRTVVMNAHAIFDVIVAAMLALVITIPIARLVRGNHLKLWFLFIACFVAGSVLPIDRDSDPAMFFYFFSRPMVWAFVMLSAFGFAIGRRLLGQPSVA